MNERYGLEAAMIECQRLWDETRDSEACITRFPQFGPAIRQHFALAAALERVRPPSPGEKRREQGWQELSSLVAFGPAPRAAALLRYAGAFAAVVVGVMAIGAAGAATHAFEPSAPVARVLDQ